MNNSFFTICTQYSKNKNDIYNCCIETCRSQSKTPNICYSTCAQIFPLIKDRCAFEQECWRDGYYNKKCLEAKSREIQNCCVERCERRKRTNPYVDTNDLYDCNRYCSDYTLR